MDKIKFSDANTKAYDIIIKMAQAEIDKGKESQFADSEDILFLIRDGLDDVVLNQHKLVQFDNHYGVDLWH